MPSALCCLHTNNNNIREGEEVIVFHRSIVNNLVEVGEISATFNF